MLTVLAVIGFVLWVLVMVALVLAVPLLCSSMACSTRSGRERNAGEKGGARHTAISKSVRAEAIASELRRSVPARAVDRGNRLGYAACAGLPDSTSITNAFGRRVGERTDL